jgi:hypothetical protein
MMIAKRPELRVEEIVGRISGGFMVKALLVLTGMSLDGNHCHVSRKPAHWIDSLSSRVKLHNTELLLQKPTTGLDLSHSEKELDFSRMHD